MGKSSKKIAIVTGGAGDIGRAIVESLRSETVIVSVDIAPITTTPFEGAKDVIYEQVGVTDEEQIRGMVTRTIENFGRVDILVNVAGGFKEKRYIWDLRLTNGMRSST